MKKFISLFISVFTLQLLVAQNAPVANNDTFTINKNNQVLLPVLSNDYDVDGDSLSITILIPAANGTAIVVDNQVQYLPDLNYVGNDSFTYVICDTTNLCDTASVLIHIQGFDNAPMAVNDSFTISENLSTVLPVTSNDYDPDGDSLTVTITIPPSHGTTTVSNNTQVTYSPSLNYFGTDSFVYTICDSSNLCDTATVYINIAGFNNPPIYIGSEYFFGDSISIETINQLVSDPDGDTVFYASIINLDSANNIGALTIDSNGALLTFTRNGIACGTNRFQFLLCDPYVCDTGIITIHITCPADVFLPEGFSPDGDGINDKLVFTGLEYFAPASLKVFNRYGTIVYENEDYQNDWDGTYMENNKALPDGTYFYVLQLANKKKYNKYLIINR